MKRVFVLISLVAQFFASAAFAADAPRNFVIVARSQGPGSTNLDSAVAAAGGTITARLPEIGVVLASSNSPDFLLSLTADSRIQQAAEDVEVQWLPK